MRARGTGAGIWILASFLTLSGQPTGPFTGQSAKASPTRNGDTAGQLVEPTRQFANNQTARAKTAPRAASHARSGGISCVPFARNDSGIMVTGNAWQWWEKAEGVYARGSVPEPGSVLTFRSNGRMRLGHVAVVSRIVNPRVVEIEHANWAGTGMRGGVARNIPVVDVSEANNWTAVRVGLGRTGEFGSVYPTYGFIYDRADTGKLIAATTVPAPKPELNPVPSDLRPVAERGWQTYEEVAEAPGVMKRHRRGIDLSPSALSTATPVVDRKQ